MAFSKLSPAAIAGRVRSIVDLKNELISQGVENIHVHISIGNNKKTGFLVPSVSLIPVHDCPNCAVCAGGCYDVRHDCIYTGVKIHRAENSAILEVDPVRYFDEISETARSFRFFRWHIGGDIKDINYLAGMVRVARANKHCKFLAFTKTFDVVNNWIEANGNLPKNLKIIFSAWPGLNMNNSYNLPVSSPVFGGVDAAPADYKRKQCPGNCSACALVNRGCWSLKSKQAVLFEAH